MVLLGAGGRFGHAWNSRLEIRSVLLLFMHQDVEETIFSVSFHNKYFCSDLVTLRKITPARLRKTAKS